MDLPVSELHASNNPRHVADRPTGLAHLASHSRMAEQKQHCLQLQDEGTLGLSPPYQWITNQITWPTPQSPRINCYYQSTTILPPKTTNFSSHTSCSLSLPVSCDDPLRTPGPRASVSSFLRGPPPPQGIISLDPAMSLSRLNSAICLVWRCGIWSVFFLFSFSWKREYWAFAERKGRFFRLRS